MKRIVLFIGLLFIGFVLSAQTLLTPINPDILGHGNATVAMPEPMRTFYYNPAGFSRESAFTISPLNVWLFTDVNTVQLLSNPEQASKDIEEGLADSNIDQEIADWLNSKTDEELAQIISDACYTELDIINAGGPEPFFDTLTEDEKISIIGLILEQPDSPVNTSDLGLPSGAFRAGAQLGLGFTTGTGESGYGGLGFGTFLTVDAELEGNNLLAAEGITKAQLTTPIGYSHAFDLGFGPLRVGAQFRPFINFTTPVNSQFVSGLLNNNTDFVSYLFEQQARREIGFGIDLGAILEIWWFNFGFSVFDILNSTTYNEGTLGSYFNGIEPPSQNEVVYSVEPTYNFGLSINPSIGSRTQNVLLDPDFYVDIRDIGGVIDSVQNGQPEEILKYLSVGADVKMLGFLSARAGYSNGYYAVGAGIDFIFLELDIAATFSALEVEDISDFGIVAELRLNF